MLFSPFSTLRPWPKADFQRFSIFSHGGNAVFAVFYSSAAAESRFSAFSARRTPTKGCFCRFLLIVPLRKVVFRRFLLVVGVRKVVFCDFSISSADDEHLSAFSAFRRPTMSVFRRFQHFVGRRRAFFSGFCISKGLDSRFLNRIHVIM